MIVLVHMILLGSAGAIFADEFVLDTAAPEPRPAEPLADHAASLQAERPSLELENERFSIHAQATTVSQGHTHFHAPYDGPNSVRSINELRSTFSATLFLGMRLWNGAEGYVNPEVAGGHGIGRGTGIAGYPNGEFAIGPDPEFYLARLFFRQTIGFGGPEEHFAAQPNQLADHHDVSRLVLTIGKMSAPDFFDTNAYANNGRVHFLNFALLNNGAWDYPADVRGYTLGAVVELNQRDWAIRYGVFAEPEEAGGSGLDEHFDKARGQALELETRHELLSQPGRIRWMVYLNRAHMGSYHRTLETPAFDQDITLSRRYSSKYGFGINLEQQITAGLGLFARVGMNDGRNESWSYTEIDRTASIGLHLLGTSWSRPDDTVGLAVAVNGLSRDHREYLAAGGEGFMLGDGRLSYAPEQIVEAFYSLRVFKGFFLTLDAQFINHPGYNDDRGPLWVGALRLHWEF